MVQRLLENTGAAASHRNDDGSSCSPAGGGDDTTPFTSCNISPESSCYVSGELSPEVYDSECTGAGSDQPPLPKKSWTKKLKQMRQAALGHKLRASREYLKSLFSLSAACAEEPRAGRRGSGEIAGGRGTKAGKRSSSVSSEAECSVQGAIAYCKKTQQQYSACARKSFGDVGCCSGAS